MRTTGDKVFPQIGNAAINVEHYAIDLEYHPGDGSIASTVTIDAQPLNESVESFSLDFEGFTVDKVKVNGETARYNRGEDGFELPHKLVIHPDESVSGEFTTEIQYHGSPQTHEGAGGTNEGWISTPDGGITLNQPVGAMTVIPLNNTPQDKATYDMTLRLPEELGGGPSAGISNGILVGKTTDDNGNSVWKWRQPRPMAPHLLLIGIGRYEQITSTVELLDGRKLESHSFIDPTIGQEAVEQAEESLALMPEYLSALENQLGSYPGASIGVVVDSIGVGYALETQDRPVFDGSLDPSTMLHELTHQWFGNALTESDWSDLWLAEAPAVFYSDIDAMEVREVDSEIVDLFYQEWKDTEADSPTWSTPMAGFDEPTKLFGDQVYRRGAMTLGFLLDEIGAESFVKVMRVWASKGLGDPLSTVTTDDFLAVIEEEAGYDTTVLRDEWVYATSKPTWKR